MTRTQLIKRFIPYYKPHRKLFCIDMICAVLIAGIELIYPAATRYILSEVLPLGNMPKLIAILVVLVLLYLIMAVLTFVVNYWGHMMGVYMESDMRRDLFKHMQKLPFKFYDNNRTGELMSRVVNDLNEVSEMAHHGPEDIFLSVFMLLGSFFYLVTIQWQMAVIIFCVAVPFIIWFTVTKRSNLSKSWREVREKMGDINSSLENSIAGIRVARAFTNERYEKVRFKESNNKFKGAKNSSYRAMASYVTGVTFFMSLLNVIVLISGGFMINRGIIDVPDLLAFMLYIALVIKPINKFTSFTQQFEKGMAGFKRFCQIMDETPDIVDKEDALKLTNVKGDIKIKNLSFSYNKEKEILKNIDLEVKAGNFVAIVGPTGSGKTTLCHLIPRFYEANSGDITLDGYSIKDITLDSLRRSVGFVQQDVFLFTGTIKENILYGRPDATDEELREAARKAEIEEFILDLEDGYDTWVGEKGILLSGGQKQRIAIARAFLKNPPILILDEATSALDNQTERKIQKALEELSRGRTSLVIAHRLSTVRHAHKIVVLTEDGVEDQGSHEELYKRDGLYRDLYDSQFV